MIILQRGYKTLRLIQIIALGALPQVAAEKGGPLMEIHTQHSSATATPALKPKATIAMAILISKPMSHPGDVGRPNKTRGRASSTTLAKPANTEFQNATRDQPQALTSLRNSAIRREAVRP